MAMNEHHGFCTATTGVFYWMFKSTVSPWAVENVHWDSPVYYGFSLVTMPS